MSIRKLRKAIEKKSVFFFAGSGISFASGLPSAYDVIENTASVFLPNYWKPNEPEQDIKGIQPEVFYGALLKVYNGNTACLNAWKALHKKTQEENGFLPKPNLVHLFISAYSYYAKKPIFTTNFDIMFEEACQVLKLPYKVFFHDNEPPITGVDSVLICKLHGSIQDGTGKYTPTNLKTTMEEISVWNKRWTDFIIEKYLSSGEICFVGYSGRDIDFFPILSQSIRNYSHEKAFWLDEFNDKSTCENAALCNAIKIYQFPSDLFPKWIAKRFPSYIKTKHFVAIKSSSKTTKIDKSQKTKKLFSTLKKEQEEKFHYSKINEESFWLLLMILTGICDDSTIQLAKKLNQDKTFLNLPNNLQLIILEANMALMRESADFIQYRKFAKEILHKYKDGKINAMVQLTSSYMMEIPHGLQFYSPRVFDIILSIFVLLHFKWSKYHIKQVIGDAYCPVFEEFLLRETAFRIGFWDNRKRVFFRLVKSTGTLQIKDKKRNEFIAIFNRLFDQAYQHGNYSTALGSCKYLFRLTGSEDMRKRGLKMAEIVHDISAVGIFLRDNALNTEQISIEQRMRELTKSLEFFQKNSNILSQIKVLLEIISTKCNAGEKDWISDDILEELQDLMSKVNSRWLQRSFRYIKRKISKYMHIKN